MTGSRPSLAATPRTELGKAVSRLRAAGRIPAVVYGHGDSESISIDAHELELLRRHVGANTLIDLKVGDERPAAVLVNGIQYHKIQRRPIHVDFYRVRMTDEMTVDVSVHGVGTSEAVERHGGTVLHAIDHVKVRARPDHLPSSLDADLSTLATFDDVIRAGDLRLPEGVVLVTDPEEVVLRLMQPRTSDEPISSAAELAASAAAEAEAPAPEG